MFLIILFKMRKVQFKKKMQLIYKTFVYMCSIYD